MILMYNFHHGDQHLMHLSQFHTWSPADSNPVNEYTVAT